MLDLNPVNTAIKIHRAAIDRIHPSAASNFIFPGYRNFSGKKNPAAGRNRKRLEWTDDEAGCLEGSDAYCGWKPVVYFAERSLGPPEINWKKKAFGAPGVLLSPEIILTT